jgi:hypothetical protein
MTADHRLQGLSVPLRAYINQVEEEPKHKTAAL